MINKKTLADVLCIRFKTGDSGTQSYLITSNFRAKILELPWRNNIVSYSCIPHGDYLCVPHMYHGRRRSYKLIGVPNRTNILIHNANFAGDRTKHLKSNVRGCLAIGQTFGMLGGQLAVLNSINTLSRFVYHTNFKKFNLKILDLTGTMKSKTQFKKER